MILNSDVWIDENTGYVCSLVEHSSIDGLFSWFSVRVGIVQTHGLYGSDEAVLYSRKCDVHGGITFAGKSENSSLWWFGFDSGHINSVGVDKAQMQKGIEFLVSHLKSMENEVVTPESWIQYSFVFDPESEFPFRRVKPERSTMVHREATSRGKPGIPSLSLE